MTSPFSGGVIFISETVILTICPYFSLSMTGGKVRKYTIFLFKLEFIGEIIDIIYDLIYRRNTFLEMEFKKRALERA